MEPQTLQPTINGSGITLLEAYSALAKNAGKTNSAIDVMAAGSLPVIDSTTCFWHLELEPVS